jgi:8-oxo-dGTP pyrophosphatase MutT (NUDIX family)
VRSNCRDAVTAYRPRELPIEGMRASAVMLLLYEQAGEEHLLFQVRTRQVAHHKGEISLPGGAEDATDESPLHTALRETHEEIGVAAEHIEVFGQLDDTPTHTSNYRIRPFAGAITQPGAYDFEHAAREVRQLLEVPLGHLLSEEARAWKVVDERGTPTPTAAFQYGEHLIWGATARIVGQFLDLVQARLPEGVR